MLEEARSLARFMGLTERSLMARDILRLAERLEAT